MTLEIPSSDRSSRIARTYFWDVFRGNTQGYTEACFYTFALLIAIRVYDAPEYVKAILPGAFSIGLLLAPFALYVITRIRLKTGTICGAISVLAAILVAIGAAADNLVAFIFFISLAQVFLAQAVLLNTQIYASNYPSRERGQRVSTAILVSSISGSIVAFAGGYILDWNLNTYKAIFFGCAFALLVGGFAFYKMPTDMMEPSSGGNPWQNLTLFWKDKVFGYLLTAWMLIGIGNLMTIPLRIEYLADPAYGINASNSQIGIIAGAIPLFMRILSTRFWGILFDRVNLIVVRLISNLFFFLGIILFFNTKNLIVLAIASALFGLALGGARVLWQLWVTKIAPPDKVSAYMSLHSAFTGVRGTLSPFFGYMLLKETDPVFVAWVAAVVIGISSIMFIPVRGILNKRTEQTHTL